MSCRSRLATLNEKLTALERRIEYIEARVSMMAKMFPCEVSQWLCKRECTLLCLAKTNRQAEINLEKLSTLLKCEPGFWDSKAIFFSTIHYYLGSKIPLMLLNLSNGPFSFYRWQKVRPSPRAVPACCWEVALRNTGLRGKGPSSLPLLLSP